MLSPFAEASFTLKYDLYFKRWGQFYFPAQDWKHWKAQGLAESRLDPSATSYCGARGIMQLMPANAKGVNGDEGNIQHGIALDKAFSAYWQKVMDIDERRDLTYASYNAGPGNILKAQKQSGGALTWALISAKLPKITGESNANQTCNYIKHIHAFYEQIK